jgi:hypothetical protein
MKEKYIQGTPPPVLLPAKNYTFKITDEHFVIELPRRGEYKELAPEIFDDESGSFELFNKDSQVFYLPAITKVLFATAKYPDLKFNQFFTPYSIKIEDEKVLIVGQVIELKVLVDEEGNVVQKEKE